MNLHQFVAGAIGAINPHITISILKATGSTMGAGGRREPTYTRYDNVPAQQQALAHNDLTLLEGMNVQGIKTALYLSGEWAGIVRADSTGGDLFIINSKTWVVATVLEDWPDWTKLALVQQIDR